MSLYLGANVMINGYVKLLYLIGLALWHTYRGVTKLIHSATRLACKSDYEKSETLGNLCGTKHVFGITRRAYRNEHVIFISQ